MHFCKRFTPILAAFAALALLPVRQAGAVTIPIKNHSFESPVVATGATSAGITDWTVLNGSAGVWNPTGSNTFSMPVPDGYQIGTIDSGAIYQKVGTLQNGAYTLSAYFGNRLDNDHGSADLALVVGDPSAPGFTVLTHVVVDEVTQVTAGLFQLFSTPTYTAASASSFLGKDLYVVVTDLSGAAQQIDIDAVQISAQVDDTVCTWGDDYYGQLGVGYTKYPPGLNLPANIGGLTGVTAIAAGVDHSLALDQSGRVWAWGYGGDGSMGNGTNNDSYVPTRVSNLKGITAIAGTGECYALDQSGTVWAWGGGYLGNGVTAGSNLPVKVTALSGITAISSGYAHSMALDDLGNVWAWGVNYHGQLGNGTTADSLIPVRVSNIGGITAISAGGEHELALDKSGHVWAWGDNVYYQLGNGSTVGPSYSSVPVQVSNLKNIVAIAAGGYFSLAIDSYGNVWSWGDCLYGEHGNGTSVVDYSAVPVQVSNLSGITAISAGMYHAMALDDSGRVWTWGGGSSGELGDGTYTQAALLPVQVQDLAGVTAISASSDGCLALIPATSGIKSLTITPYTSTVQVGTAVTLHVVANFKDGSSKDVTSDPSTNYTVTHGTGTLTGSAYTAIRSEAAVIAVTYSSGGSTAAGAAYITENSGHGRIVGSSFSPSSIAVIYPAPVTFAFTVVYQDGTVSDVSTSPNTVYTLAHGVGTLTGNSYASFRSEAAVITAVYTDPETGQVLNKVGYIMETAPAILKKIAVTPLKSTVAHGTTVTFTVTATYSDGSTRDVSTNAHTTYSITHGVGTLSGDTYTSPRPEAAVIGVTYVEGGYTVSGIAYVTSM